MEKTLYVTDLDGTLLNKNERISPYSLNILNELIDKGMLFTYATARSLVSASVVTEGLSTNVSVIVYNGAFILKPATGEILSQEKFSSFQMQEVGKILAKYQVSPLVYAWINGEEKLSWLTQKENAGIRHYLNSRKGDRRLNPLTKQQDLYQGDMFYFTCIGEKEELQPIYDFFHSKQGYRCTLQQEIYRPEYWCEIMPGQATKSNAIQKLKDRYGCSKVVSFGDAINDIPMFDISDEAYAVENAVEELKAKATGIIAGNDRDGVANWLKEHVVLQKD